MRARWVRLSWGLAAFVPLAIIGTPIFAYQIGVIFLFCAVYLWPASWVAQQLGIEPFTFSYTIVAGVYCAALGTLVETIAARLFKWPAHIARTRALVLVAIVWVPIGLFAGYQMLDYKGVLSTERPCPGHIYALMPHCADISHFREHELAGFIDRSFVATMRVRPGVLAAIATANEMREIAPSEVPESFWRQPPIWWNATRTGAAHVHMTPGFAFEGRGRDGDYYLVIEDRQTGDVFVYFQNNF